MIIDLTSKKITELDLDFVKNFLKIDFNDEDALVQALILGAYSYIETALGFKIIIEWPIVGDIPDELTIAALLLISHWYVNREIQTQGTLGTEVNFAVSALLDAHKRPLKDYKDQ